VFLPVVDGSFISQRPTESLRAGKVNGNGILTSYITMEGSLFINATAAETGALTTFIAQLFPELKDKYVEQAAELYSGLGDSVSQVIAVMGEAIFMCPTHFLLNAFPGRAFKALFAIPQGSHASDLFYYFPTLNLTLPTPYNILPPPVVFNNSDFKKAFTQSFMNFAISSDVNKKLISETITPFWPIWEGEIEMLFNKTEAGEPVVKSVSVSSALLERCAFWESVGAQIGQ